VAPPGFCNKGEVRYGSIGGLEYEVPQSRLYCLCINVALCSTALQCICRVIRRRSMTMKAHTYYIIFGLPPIGGSFPPPPGGATAMYVYRGDGRRRRRRELAAWCEGTAEDCATGTRDQTVDRRRLTTSSIHRVKSRHRIYGHDTVAILWV